MRRSLRVDGLYCLAPDELQCHTAASAVSEGQAMMFDCMVEYNVDLNDRHPPTLTWYSDTSSLYDVTEIVSSNDGGLSAR